MGMMKKINPVVPSCEVVVLESGKLLRRYWHDVSMNRVIGRIPE